MCSRTMEVQQVPMERLIIGVYKLFHGEVFPPRAGAHSHGGLTESKVIVDARVSVDLLKMT